MVMINFQCDVMKSPYSYPESGGKCTVSSGAKQKGWVLLTGLTLLCCVQAWSTVHAADTSPAAQLKRWSDAAGAPGDVLKGERLFNQKHGDVWSCASCHNSPPTTVGKHASTAKSIKPLAPAFNAQALTESAKVDKWFKRNCRDVLKRECTPAEKADVLAYLLSLKK